jgi:hypothetical protein
MGLLERAIQVDVSGFRDWFLERWTETRLCPDYDEYLVGEVMGLLGVRHRAYQDWEGKDDSYPVPEPMRKRVRGGPVQRVYTAREVIDLALWYYQHKVADEESEVERVPAR